MSADLYLIATPGEEVWHERLAFVNGADFLTGDAGAQGVRDDDGYLLLGGVPGASRGLTFAERDAIYAELGYEDLPRVWIGQVSWVKGYVPEPVRRVVQIIGEGRVLTAGVAGEVLAALNLPNTSMYGHTRVERVTDPERVAWYRQVSRTARGRRMYGRFREPGFILSRTRGLEKRRVVKGWLRENIGSVVIAESE